MMFKANIYIPSTAKTVVRYVEAVTISGAKALLDGCFAGVGEVKSMKRVDKFDEVNGYVILPVSSAQW